jgi:Integrase core domain
LSARSWTLWAFIRGVALEFSRPGKPTDNAFIESFNCKFRSECLNANLFLSLDEARRKCEAFRPTRCAPSAKAIDKVARPKTPTPYLPPSVQPTKTAIPPKNLNCEKLSFHSFYEFRVKR